jgi:hypothetical protein
MRGESTRRFSATTIRYLTATQGRLPRKTKRSANGLIGSRRRGARLRRVAWRSADSKRDPRREVAGRARTGGSARGGNLALGRG